MTRHTVQAQTALSKTTETMLVCVRPDVTLDGVMYIQAMVDPSKSSFMDQIDKFDTTPKGNFKTKR